MMRSRACGSARSTSASLVPSGLRTGCSSEALVDLADPHARERIMGAILAFVEARAKQDPILYVFEDAHNADALTLDVMTRVASFVKDGRFLFVVTTRPDPVVGHLRRSFGETILLDVLDEAGIAALVKHEMKADDVDGRFLAFLAGRTGGNPGHLVEILRFLKERALVTVRGGTVVAPTGDIAHQEGGFLDAVVPSTLAHVALARLDELGEVERRMLRTASVIGQRIPKELLEKVTNDDVDATTLYAAMANLEGERVLAPEGTEGGWAFKDDVTRAVAYGTIPDAKRREVHRRIADALEQLPESEPARTPAAMAIHRERAGQLLQSAVWYERAARLATTAGLDEETIRLVDSWEKIVADLQGPDRPAPTMTSRMALAKLVALGRTGIPADCVRQGQLVVDQHWAHLDDEAKVVVDRWLGEGLLWMGQRDAARLRLERVHQDAREPALRCDAATLVARAYEFAGDRARAEEWLQRAATNAAGDDDRTARVEMCRAHLVVSADDLALAVLQYDAVRARAKAQRHVRLEAAATNGRAHACMALRRFDEAIAGFHEAHALFIAIGSWSDVANVLVNIGQAHLWCGRLDDARRQLETAIGLAEETRDEMAMLEARIHLGAATALTTDVVEGNRLLAEGEDGAAVMGWREPRVAAALHRAHIAVVAGDGPAAQAALGAAQALLGGEETPLFRGALDELAARAAGLVGRSTDAPPR